MAKFTLADGTEIEAFTPDELKSQLATETAGLKNKVEELLGEKKTVSQRAQELEDQAKAAEEAALKEKQEFGTLYSNEKEARLKEQEENKAFREQIKNKDIELAAASIGSAGVDESSAKLLAREAKEYAKYDENGVHFEIGGVVVEKEKVIELLSEEYPRLFAGSQASGGGATGNKNSDGVAKKFADYSPTELAEIRRNNPADYERLRTTR